MHERISPFKCSLCERGFSSRGDLRRHHNAVHHTFKSFPELKGVEGSLAAVVTFRQAVIALALSLVSAGFFALLVRFGFPGAELPVFLPAVAAQVFGFSTGICYLVLKRNRRTLNVANKQQKLPQKVA